MRLSISQCILRAGSMTLARSSKDAKNIPKTLSSPMSRDFSALIWGMKFGLRRKRISFRFSFSPYPHVSQCPRTVGRCGRILLPNVLPSQSCISSPDGFTADPLIMQKPRGCRGLTEKVRGQKKYMIRVHCSRHKRQ